ncbi:bifunctional non-homologous end joining protein LigD [Paenibacillus sp. BK033]|uniref:non-homologous end-joining DNA ligase n=1 Tax=Paenibacillus sp. BK033 TaxID=2512133 RepID=UPI00104FB832|nr:non-homologous end-joining DNA ligase [Paenibacillus sp. BK033]TCM96865.1 bifunctional non-homologous end joining protein LigD [Paenibacillus sp. BK033]
MEEVVVDGKRIEITHPDRIIWKAQGISKLDYIHYLVSVSPYMIQHAKNRLLMVWLYPHGITGKKIEKRSVPASAPEWVSQVFYKSKERILLNDTSTLVWAANYGAVEFHVPFDRYDKTDYPMEMVFDLDPPDDKSFHRVIEVALMLKELLQSLGLSSVPRTSGSSGLQVFVPIEPVYTFEQTRKITAFIANYFREQMPERITLERVVSKRGDKLYFDYLQLWRGRTMPVVYSPRAKPNATVAAPLTWSELAEGVQPTDFTMLNIAGRISEKGDLFQPLTTEKQNQSLHEILAFMERNKG